MENETTPAYIIEDPYAGSFAVKSSANAWWMNRVKVELLIAGFKMGSNIKTACVHAGISLDQYKYFNEVHPEFSTIKVRCKRVLGIRAQLTIAEHMDDPKIARWYLEKRCPEYFDVEKEEEGFQILTHPGLSNAEIQDVLVRVAKAGDAQRNTVL